MDGVSFQVPVGEVFVLLGPNGPSGDHPCVVHGDTAVGDCFSRWTRQCYASRPAPENVDPGLVSTV